MADPPSPRLDEDDAFGRDFNASPSPDAAPARSGAKRPFGDLYLYLYSHGEVSLAASQPVLLYAILLMILLSPFDMFYLSSRFYFLRTVWHIILPLQSSDRSPGESESSGLVSSHSEHYYFYDQLQDQELPFDMGEKKKKKKKKKKDVTSVVWYATRVIEFLGRRTLIILKNKDTRCSLVALCNVLLLGEKITLNLDIKKVSEGHLIYLVQSYLLCGNTQMQLDQNLELSEFNKQVLGVLPKLSGSLYFDVTFASSSGFEQTSETALFGFLGVPLHHGWMVDPQDVELGSSIPRSPYSKLSYNLAVYESIRSRTNSGPQKHGGCEDDMFYSDLAFSLTGSEELGSTSCAMISTLGTRTEIMRRPRRKMMRRPRRKMMGISRRKQIYLACMAT